MLIETPQPSYDLMTDAGSLRNKDGMLYYETKETTMIIFNGLA
jgi:hypothetical protein